MRQRLRIQNGINARAVISAAFMHALDAGAFAWGIAFAGHGAGSSLSVWRMRLRERRRPEKASFSENALNAP
jgi:hypothetical protein